jgi:hypothetical protein
MARLTEQEVANLAQQYLQSGEQLQYAAVAMSLPMWALFMGAIIAALFRKWYVVALTDRRLLLIRYKNRLVPQEITEYELRQLPRLKFVQGTLNATLKVQDPRGTVTLKFGRLLTKQNRENALALGAGLTAASQAAAPAGFNSGTAAPSYGSNPGPYTGPVVTPPQVPVLKPQNTAGFGPNGASGMMSIRIGTRAIPLPQNARLTEDDLPGLLTNDPNHIVAIVEPNPANPAILGLRNLSTSPWNATLTSGERREVPAGRAIKLDRGTQLDFGFVQGVVD